MKNSAERIMALFRGSDSWHGTHGEPELAQNGVKWEIKKTAKTLSGEPSLDLWKAHLDGKKPLGVAAIMDDSQCAWGSIDVDQYDIDALEVIRKIDAAKLPLVPCRSKSGGLHLFLFCQEPMAAEAVQNVLRDIAASLGFAGSEIFPKQTSIDIARGDKGSWMVMPYFGGDFGGKLRFQYGIKKTGAEMTLDEFLGISEKKKVTADDLLKIRTSINATDAPRSNGAVTGGKKKKEPFHDGPPCLQHLAKSGFPDGGRNNALFHIGVYHRRAYPDTWQQKLSEDNFALMKPPLPMEEVTGLIRSLNKKDYEYKCKDQPMAAFCQSTACRGRKFGVGGGAFPSIEGIRKLMTEPCLWFVDIPGGKKPLCLTTDQLMDYRRFQKQCMEQVSVPFRLVTDQVWSGTVTEAMASYEEIEAPVDATMDGAFRRLLREFLTNRTVGDRMEDLDRNVPWEDEENSRFVFSLESIMRFIDRERIKGWPQEQVVRWLDREIKAQKILLNIKGRRNLRFWEIPSSQIDRAPKLDAPEPEKEII